MKKKITLLAAMVLGAAVAGCSSPLAVGIDYKAPEQHAPDGYGEAHNGPTTQPSPTLDLTQWWTTFHDREMESLIKRAQENNLDLLQAEARVREARAQLGATVSALFPTVDTSLGYTKSQSSKNGTSISGTGVTGTTGTGGTSSALAAFSRNRRSEVYSGGFDAGWEIDVFGGIRRSIEASSANLESQVELRRNVLVTVTAEVAVDYVLLRGYQAQLKTTEENLASQKQSLELTRSRFNAGLTSDLDVAQAQANAATTASQIPTLQIQIRQTIHAISLLLGEEPMALADELGKDAPIPPVPSEIPVGLPSELIRRRPDVRAAERSLAASTANIGVQVAQLFPRFSLTGSLGQQSGRFGLIALADQSSFWSIGPTVSWRIFDAFQLRNQVRVANAQQEQALLAYRQTVLSSFTDVENALVAYAQDQNRTRALSDAAAANQRAYELSNQLYVRGLGDFLNVLTAQRNLFTAQNDMTVSQTNVATDLIQLYKALGGGWDPNNEKQFQKNEDPALPANYPVPTGSKVEMKSGALQY